MSIYLKQYTASVKILVPQVVRCVHCDREFIYEMTVTGSGSATGIASASGTGSIAEEYARDDLEERLSDPELHDAIPCPACYHYQPYMYQRVRSIRFADAGCLGQVMVFLGLLVAIVSGITSAILEEDRTIFVGAAIGGLVIAVIGYVMIRRSAQRAEQYDPNTEQLEQRMLIAQTHAMTQEQFDALQATRLQKELVNQKDRLESDARRPKRQRLNRKPPVWQWWVPPSLLINGGTISIPVTATEVASVVIPEDTEEGTVFKPRLDSQTVPEFKVRVLAIRVHPDEMRLD